jgi:hypothetical protein
MKKIILVIYNPSTENDVLKDRIKSLGRNYVFWNNHWLVETDLTAEQVYHKLAYDGFEKQSFFISEIKNKVSEGYWGVMNASLWDWLKNK